MYWANQKSTSASLRSLKRLQEEPNLLVVRTVHFFSFVNKIGILIHRWLKLVRTNFSHLLAYMATSGGHFSRPSGSDRPKQCFTVLPEPNRTSQLKFSTARPRDTRFLVPGKKRAAQNRASWGLYLCTKWDFFSKNSVSSRLLFKIRVSWGYNYVLKGIFISFF